MNARNEVVCTLKLSNFATKCSLGGFVNWSESLTDGSVLMRSLRLKNHAHIRFKYVCAATCSDKSIQVRKEAGPRVLRSVHDQ